MARLTERAEEMGATTKFTAKEAAAGNTDLATTSYIVTDTPALL